MIITITGAIASGKSTVAKMLATELGYKRYSSGDFFRQLAAEKGMNVMEFSQFTENDEGTSDREIDERQKKLWENENDFVIDGRLSFRFIPHSFKVRLIVDPEEAARRIFGDASRGSADSYASVESAYNAMVRRRLSERERYMKYYGIDPNEFTESDFDITVDTTSIHAAGVTAAIIEKMGRLENKI